MRGLIGLFPAFAVSLGAGAVAAAEGEAGLPQLNPEYYPSQVIWLGISFVLLYVLMAWLVLPRISRILEERQDRIEGNLGRAETIRTEAQAVAQVYEKSLAEATAAAQTVIAKARERLAADAAQRHAELGERLNAEIAEAEGRILSARDASMANLRDLAVDVASSAAERLAGEAVDASVMRTVVDDVLKERGR